jgi:diguanylate cyclase (GGDEF)-like protein/PAS domain S-box-containing protein
MIRLGRRHRWWLIALALFTVTAGLRALGTLQPLENAFADQRARWFSHEVRSDIVIVGIDAASVAALDQWPWPRRHHAQLIDQLARSAPRSVFLDIDFSAQSNSLDDAMLESSLNKPRDFPVILPAFFQNSSGTDQSVVISKPRPRFARRTEHAMVNALPGLDGLTRTWRTSWNIEGAREPSVIDLDRRLPDDSDVRIDYSIAPGSFTYVSYVDVLAGVVPREVFAGKKVFVGATALELGDMVPVPVHRSLPGVVVQALAAETVQRGAPRLMSWWAALGLLAFWTALAAFLSALNGARWVRNLATASLLLGAIFASSVWLFEAQNLWLEVAAPALAVSLLFVACVVSSLQTQTWRVLAYALGMRRRDALLKSIVHSSTDCIVCIDEAGIIKTANPAAARLFDCPVHELIDAPFSRVITLLAVEDPGARLGALHGVLRECDARTARGDVFPVEISVSRVRAPSAQKDERLYTAIVRDIRERRAQQRRLQHQATHDSLTGLPNRAALLTQLEQSLVTGSAPSAALLMLDLCRFKEVNDTLGHNVGDRVLCDVAQRFASALGGKGLIARIGGDEFTVVLDSPESAEYIATTSRQLADCLRAPIDVAGISIEVGVSIGIARFPQDAADAQALLRHADVAMYVAKRRGVSYEFYDAAFDENTVRKLTIGGELRSAIAGNLLELHYQPQVNLRSSLVESCEALVRWTHPVQGAISPAEFVAIAEATDLIRPLTEWTLSCALSQARAWRDRGVHLRVAVNLSARLLQDTAFPARLRELLRDSGVAATSLELEITESAMMLDPARALRVIQEIDKLGVLISIDDFGTGYSSLGYLRDLPVHALKLDKSFVMGMRDNGDDRIIVESTAKMAHALKLELVAEGVESDWDADFLEAAGYDFAQGFRYSRALAPEKFLAWVVEYNATALLSGAGQGFDESATPANASRVPLLLQRRHPADTQLEPDVGSVVEVLQILRHRE